ncbi:hypothetical protein ONO57_27045, partial [Salmonella enterica subsp. enterica serovar Anatum]|nr:hypothetical protein [Salmonella enterica subsp. enterica serovar Anatum]
DADIEAALQKADALYHSDWSKGEIDQRLPVLHKLADLIDSRVRGVLFNELIIGRIHCLVSHITCLLVIVIKAAVNAAQNNKG